MFISLLTWWKLEPFDFQYFSILLCAFRIECKILAKCSLIPKLLRAFRWFLSCELICELQLLGTEHSFWIIVESMVLKNTIDSSAITSTKLNSQICSKTRLFPKYNFLFLVSVLKKEYINITDCSTTWWSFLFSLNI